jgi:hypothetical protein
MVKKQAKLTPIQELSTRLSKLMDTRLRAYSSGASGHILDQIESMIAETQLDIYTAQEIDYHRNKKDDDDGEQWIV